MCEVKACSCSASDRFSVSRNVCGLFDVGDVVVVAMFSGKLAGVRVAVACVKSKLARAAPVSDFLLPFAFLAFSMALAIIEEGFMVQLQRGFRFLDLLTKIAKLEKLRVRADG